MLHYCMARKRYVPVKLSADGYEQISALADDEAEGNVSGMVRKLLDEALVARGNRGLKTSGRVAPGPYLDWRDSD